jgi:hypothetical protein
MRGRQKIVVEAAVASHEQHCRVLPVVRIIRRRVVLSRPILDMLMANRTQVS